MNTTTDGLVATEPSGRARLALWRTHATDRRTATNLGRPQRVASVGAGAALIAWGIARRDLVGVALGLTGAVLVRRGVRGHSEARRLLGVREDGTLRLARAVTIARPAEEVFARLTWLEKLPELVPGVRAVTRLGDRVQIERSDGGRIALLATDHPDSRRITLRAEGDPSTHAEIRLVDAPGGRGTEVHVRIETRPTLGALGASVARARWTSLDTDIGLALRRLAQVLVLGTTVTVEGQPHGGGARKGLPYAPKRHEEVAR